MSAQAQAGRLESDEMVLGCHGVGFDALTALLRGIRALFLILYDDDSGNGAQPGGYSEAVSTPTFAANAVLRYAKTTKNPCHVLIKATGSSAAKPTLAMTLAISSNPPSTNICLLHQFFSLLFLFFFILTLLAWPRS